MKKVIAFLLGLGSCITGWSQSIGIGTAAPNASAILDVSSNNKGLLLPRMSSVQRNSIASPVKGLIIFDNTKNSFWYYTGTAWKELAGNAYSSDSTLVLGQQAGSIVSHNLTGNLNSSDSSGYLYDSGGPSGNYGNNENFVYTIYQSTINQLATDIMVLSNNLESTYDSLFISDNYGHRYVLMGTSTGSYRVFGQVTIRFKSNFTNTTAGFAIRWNGVFSGSNNYYDANQTTGWYYNPAKNYMRGGVNANNTWSPDSSGLLSFAFGNNSKAKGNYSVAFGLNTLANFGSFASGINTVASGGNSIAIGDQAIASADFSISIGENNTASAVGSTAIGSITWATGDYSTALGFASKSSGIFSTAMGNNSLAIGDYSTAMGTSFARGYYSTAMGYYTNANGSANTAMGEYTTASSQTSTAMGAYTIASGNYSTAMGQETHASGISSTSMGLTTIASGNYSTAMGNNSQAIATNSTAMGDNTIASEESSIAMGHYTTASGFYSTAMGYSTIASSGSSTAMGFATNASAGASTAMGFATAASGHSSTSIGYSTKSKSFGGLSIGIYNDSTNAVNPTAVNSLNRVFQIGNGTADNARSNAMTVLQNGNIGIGELNPSVPLNFAAALGNKISLWGTAANHYGMGIQSNLMQFYIPSNGDDIAFGYGSSAAFEENIRFKGNGFVGIGTSTPAYMLTVRNDINVDNGDANAGTVANTLKFGGNGTGESIGSNRTTATNQWGLDFYTNSVNRMAISLGGNIGIGTTAPTAKLSVNGAANNATGNWGVFSDARVKTISGNFTDGLNVISRINPVTFSYNANAPFTTTDVQIGIVAQELEKIAPYMVSKQAFNQFTDLREVNNQAYVFLLINAVKEQQVQITKQQKENKELLERLEKLEKIVNEFSGKIN